MTRRAAGSSSWSRARRLLVTSENRDCTPVMRPPGRAMLSTRPKSTGSLAGDKNDLDLRCRSLRRQRNADREGDDHVHAALLKLPGRRFDDAKIALSLSDEDADVASAAPLPTLPAVRRLRPGERRLEGRRRLASPAALERRARRPLRQPLPRGRPAASFDHLVGAGEERGGIAEAERFRSLQIDDRARTWSAARPAGRRASRP